MKKNQSQVKHCTLELNVVKHSGVKQSKDLKIIKI